MNRYTSNFISSFKEGMKIRNFFICKKISHKMTRLGDPYLDILLEDKTGIIRGKVWLYSEVFKKNIKEGFPVAIKGDIVKFNDVNEINISFINYANEFLYSIYGFQKNKLVQTIDEDLKPLINYLNNKIKKLNPIYLNFINKIINKNLKKIKNIPSLNKKYNISGGFLLEIVSVLKLNDKISPLYKNLDQNFIILGIILKNIGLIDYFNDDLFYSIKNNCINTNILSISIINECCYDKKYNEIKLKLHNLILSENDTNDVNIAYINGLYKFNSLNI